MLPKSGKLMLELGAGAGRNTPRYAGFERIVLFWIIRPRSWRRHRKNWDVPMPKYIYVAADIYRLPFRDRQFDAATMIRALHHMADAPKALEPDPRTFCSSNAVFILEFANKLNLKSILRYWLGKQDWNPFTLEPVEFVKLNFDFHPRAIRNWLGELGLFHREDSHRFTLPAWLAETHHPSQMAGCTGWVVPADTRCGNLHQVCS
jgi:ubiquinone/menaquinone biosynthesis C-methylase UbiE